MRGRLRRGDRLEDGSVYELATYANGKKLASTLPSD